VREKDNIMKHTAEKKTGAQPASSEAVYCTLYLVRHGETEGNAKQVVNGHQDAPLTENGVAQIETVREKLRGVHFDAAYSSDLPRTVRTARIIAQERNLAIQTSRLLRDRFFGEFEGKTYDELGKAEEKLREALSKMQSLSGEERWMMRVGEKVESDGEVAMRFITGLREIAVAWPGKNVLVATHGGCIRLFLMRVGFQPYGALGRGAFSNAGFVKVRCDGVDFFVDEVSGLKK
jgi:broad specificity phosphatase PhoE